MEPFPPAHEMRGLGRLICDTHVCYLYACAGRVIAHVPVQDQ